MHFEEIWPIAGSVYFKVLTSSPRGGMAAWRHGRMAANKFMPTYPRGSMAANDFWGPF